MTGASIEHVSDTAIWVAFYRAEETDRADALFKDPLARKLVGERGRALAAASGSQSIYVRHNVVFRTYIIDKFIHDLVSKGVDTIVNLGAGLDTRPYRMKLPSSLRWIEVDYSYVMETKARTLADEKPKLSLERESLDLANRDARKLLFARIGRESKHVAILTEGLLPYLSVDDVSMLAQDLYEQTSFEYWISDYMSPMMYKYLKNPRQVQHLRNAPFKFFPKNPIAFFESNGWTQDEVKYIQQTTHDLGANQPRAVVCEDHDLLCTEGGEREGHENVGLYDLKKKMSAQFPARSFD